ncbi:MAG: hypothetical protein COB29_15685 [Sulfitobacter sp.]|nr:MAG: hypothetical protein COB29_15685 [Sulfitobacter sp.]
MSFVDPNDSNAAVTKLALPTWNGSPTTFAAYDGELTLYLVLSKLGYALTSIRDSTGIPFPKNAQGQNDDDKKAEGMARAYAVIASTVNVSERTTIINNWNNDEANANDQITIATPQTLYEAYKRHSKGAVVALSGPMLHKRWAAYKFPANGTYVERVKMAIRDLRAFREQAVAVADDDYPISEGMCIFKFCELMPHRYQMEYSKYDELKKLHELDLIASTAAIRYDATPAMDQQFKVLAALSARHEYRSMIGKDSTDRERPSQQRLQLKAS